MRTVGLISCVQCKVLNVLTRYWLVLHIVLYVCFGLKWQQRGCLFSIDGEQFWFSRLLVRSLGMTKLDFEAQIVQTCLLLWVGNFWIWKSMHFLVLFLFLLFLWLQMYSLLIMWYMGIRDACLGSPKWPFWVCFSFLSFSGLMCFVSADSSDESCLRYKFKTHFD